MREHQHVSLASSDGVSSQSARDKEATRGRQGGLTESDVVFVDGEGCLERDIVRGTWHVVLERVELDVCVRRAVMPVEGRVSNKGQVGPRRSAG